MNMKMKVQRVQRKGFLAGMVQTCDACGAKIIWARDDRFPEKQVGTLVNVVPEKQGTVVLWYEVTKGDKPIGSQWFRAIEENSDYAGDRWNAHIFTCSKQLGVPDVRTV